MLRFGRTWKMFLVILRLGLGLRPADSRSQSNSGRSEKRIARPAFPAPNVLGVLRKPFGKPVAMDELQALIGNLPMERRLSAGAGG